MTPARKDRLGRGLGALLGEYSQTEKGLHGHVRTVPVADVEVNPYQPRKDYSEEDLTDLTTSIREHGLLQPLVVRAAGPGRYQLIAGERRLRSLQRLGWSEVPVVLRDVSDETLLVLALVENLQRQELNPLEEAEGYRQLSEQFGLTQEEIARAVGKDRSTVTNLLRLLRLPPSVRRQLVSGALTMGHARALLSINDPVRAAELARRAVEEDWSVRDVERQVRRGTAPTGGGATERDVTPKATRDTGVRTLEEALSEHLATRVEVRIGKKGTGVIRVSFHGPEDLERIFALFTRSKISDVVG
ncbi:MAG: ParB/RepB/Spo0J family partition protein [Gemmatimonadota bacterium]|nr:ParB/RepB/Spo0J family partition protein [Gemmatimonadota bacterium]